MASTVFQTVISGVFVFVFSEIIVRCFFIPIQEYRKVVARIDNRLKFYANAYGHSTYDPKLPAEVRERFLNVVDTIRELSCDLEAIYKQIPLRWFFIWIPIIPPPEELSDAGSRLIRLSNKTARPLNSTDWAMIESDEVTIRKILSIPKL